MLFVSGGGEATGARGIARIWDSGGDTESISHFKPLRLL